MDTWRQTQAIRVARLASAKTCANQHTDSDDSALVHPGHCTKIQISFDDGSRIEYLFINHAQEHSLIRNDLALKYLLNASVLAELSGAAMTNPAPEALK